MTSNTPSRPSLLATSMVSWSLGFKHELDVKFAKRIIELAQRPRQHRQHRRLLEHRHQHGKDRQFIIGERARGDGDGLVAVG